MSDNIMQSVGSINVGDVVTLNTVLIGTSGIIVKVNGEGRVRRRLFDMGLTP